jgi:pimeloyl-ACP methyl ester carboxylesterase
MTRTEQFIDGPQGKLWTSSSGDPASPNSPAILLVHCDLGTLGQWDGLRDALQGRYATIAFDRRGHGQSDLPRDGRFSSDDHASDVVAIADALRLERFALIGHSGGALAAWTVAATQNDRVKALLLVDPPVDPSTFPAEQVEQTLAAMRGPNYQDVAANYYRSIGGPHADVVERIVADARAAPQATLVGGFEALRNFEPRRLAGRYSGPTLSVIQPQYDIDGALHRMSPGWPHVVIPGTGHWVHLDAPGPFLDIATRFLRR